MHMKPYIGKELHHWLQKDIPVNYKIIGYESHLHPSAVTRGAPCSNFTPNVKIPWKESLDNSLLDLFLQFTTTQVCSMTLNALRY